MQCEECSGAATVCVTEISNGKATDHWLCHEHAVLREKISPFPPGAWDNFWEWVVEYFRANARMPSITEIAGQGDVGSRLAKFNADRPGGLLEELLLEVENRISQCAH